MQKILMITLLGLLAAWWINQTITARNLPGQGVQFFEGSYQQGLETAAVQNKWVFVDLYASWCGPCKRLKANTFTDENLAAYMARHFVALAIDGEKGEGPALMQRFQVRAYPTLLVLNAQGKEVGRIVGFVSAEKLQQELEKITNSKS